jgi:hypothetical protein
MNFSRENFPLFAAMSELQESVMGLLIIVSGIVYIIWLVKRKL